MTGRRTQEALAAARAAREEAARHHERAVRAALRQNGS